MVWTPPITWLAGKVLPAATLDEQMRDNLNALTDFAAYVPVLTSSGTAPATSAALGGYIHAGNLVQGWFELTLSAPGTGNYTVSLPVTAAASWFPRPFGQVTCINGSGQFFSRQLICTGSPIIAAMTGDAGTRVSATSPFTFAASHNICGTFMYEAAP